MPQIGCLPGTRRVQNKLIIAIFEHRVLGRYRFHVPQTQAGSKADIRAGDPIRASPDMGKRFLDTRIWKLQNLGNGFVSRGFHPD